jgi:hypothetical protein
MASDPTPHPLSSPPQPTSSPGTGRRRKRPLLERLLTGRHYDDQVVVYRHTNFFYWWPVWLVGFVCAGICGFSERRMAIVPAHTEAVMNRQVEVADGGALETRDVLILPKGKHLEKVEDADGKETPRQPTIHTAPHRSVGTIYLGVLLIVIVLTNISMRGLWSVLVMMTVVLLIIILYLSNTLSPLFQRLGLLAIYLNMGGYIVISATLLVLWALNYFILDRMTYMIFTPGQVRVRLEIGGGETVYDATGMTIQKQRADMFRHWGLGFGSGDLLIFPLNAGHAIELPNVLRVGRVVREIETMVKEKVVVTRDVKAG